jgi:uncharacterized protein with beta-barrel porin domain
MKSCSQSSAVIDAIAQIGSSVAGARRTVRLAAALALACAGLTLAVAPASAACVPGGPAIASGSSVTCTGADVNGVGNGSQSNVTVNVQPGASINFSGNNGAIYLSSQNTITNAGTITAANFGILVTGPNNTITNSGTISAGSIDSFDILIGSGIATNTSTGILKIVASQGTGIYYNGSGTSSTIVNNGTIMGSAVGTPDVLGSGGTGILSGGPGANVTNNGAISLGIAGAGIWVGGTSGTYVNNGTINVGDGQAAGINIGTVLTQSQVQNNTIVNNGVIRAGANSYSLYEAQGSNFIGLNAISNKGVLDGKIYIYNDNLTNSGIITITNAGTPLFDSFNAVQNYFLKDGSFIQTSTGTLALRVNSAGASDGLAALLGAQLGGTLGAVVQPGFYAATTKYAGVISAPFGTIAGQFASVQAFAAGTTTPLAYFTASATYNTQSVDLTLNRLGFGAVSGETFNQQQVGNALNAGYSSGLTGNAATFYANLLQSTSTGALDQLSGEGTSATQSSAFFANNLFNNLMGSRALGWRSGDTNGFIADTPLGYAGEPSPTNAFAAFTKAPPQAFVPGWRAWGAGFGGGQSIGADPSVGAAGISSSAAGGAIGLDHQLDSNLLVGASVGGSHSSFSVPDRATTGSADAFQAGAYFLRQWGSVYLMGLGSYAHFDNQTSRTIAGIGPTETATGAFGSDLIGGRLEIGNTFRTWGINLTPFAAVQVSSLHQAGYTESSTTLAGAPGVLGLAYQPVTTTSLPTFLGVQFDTAVPLPNGMTWSPFARTSWVHEFDPARNITASLIALNNPAFTVDGARAASDSAKLDLGSQLAITRNVSLIASFNGEFSGREQIYSGMGALRVSW